MDDAEAVPAGPSQECSGTGRIWRTGSRETKDERRGAAGEDQEKPGSLVAA